MEIRRIQKIEITNFEKENDLKLIVQEIYFNGARRFVAYLNNVTKDFEDSHNSIGAYSVYGDTIDNALKDLCIRISNQTIYFKDELRNPLEVPRLVHTVLLNE
jgi:hypothetical protein